MTTTEDQLLAKAAVELYHTERDMGYVGNIVRWMTDKLNSGHSVTMTRGFDWKYCKIEAGDEVRVIDLKTAEKVAAVWNRLGRRVKAR